MTTQYANIILTCALKPTALVLLLRDKHHVPQNKVHDVCTCHQKCIYVFCHSLSCRFMCRVDLIKLIIASICGNAFMQSNNQLFQTLEFVNLSSDVQYCTSFYPNVTTLRSGLCYRNSVCRLSVCNVSAIYSGGWSFRQYFFTAVYAGNPLASVQNFTEIVLGEPLRGER